MDVDEPLKENGTLENDSAHLQNFNGDSPLSSSAENASFLRRTQRRAAANKPPIIDEPDPPALLVSLDVK